MAIGTGIMVSPLSVVAGSLLPGTTANSFLYADSANTLRSTAAGNNLVAATSGAGVPAAVTATVVQGGTGQTTYTNGQLLIGNTTGNTLAKATLTPTTNQTTVTNGAGTITIGTVQDIGTVSAVTFGSMKINTIGAVSRVNIETTSIGVTTYPLMLINAGAGTANDAVGMYFSAFDTGATPTGSIVNTRIGVTGGYAFTFSQFIGSLQETFKIDQLMNVLIGQATAGTSAEKVLSAKTGVAPATGPADTVQFYSSDDAAGHTIPSFYCEGTNVLATGQADSTSSIRVKMRINGIAVTLLAI